MSEPVEKCEKLAIARISRKTLTKLLCLPTDVQIDMVSYEDSTGAAMLRLSGEGLPDNCSVRDFMDIGHLLTVRLSHKATTAVTFEDAPRRVDYIEFDRFS